MSPQRGILAAVLLCAAACGSKSKTPVEPHETEPAPDTFKDMNHDQRVEFMKTVVMPTMKPIFVAFDTEFEEMDCKTCHGAGAESGTFEMPNPELPVLPGTEEAFGEYMKDPDHAKWAMFMIQQVKPKMAELLKMSEFDPATGQGDFSCANCHTMEGGAPPADSDSDSDAAVDEDSGG
jgi:hypothetical protein